MLESILVTCRCIIMIELKNWMNQQLKSQTQKDDWWVDQDRPWTEFEDAADDDIPDGTRTSMYWR